MSILNKLIFSFALLIFANSYTEQDSNACNAETTAETSDINIDQESQSIKAFGIIDSNNKPSDYTEDEVNKPSDYTEDEVNGASVGIGIILLVGGAVGLVSTCILCAKGHDNLGLVLFMVSAAFAAGGGITLSGALS